MEDARIVAELQAHLRERIGAERFGLWFDGHTRFLLNYERLIVYAANTFARDWLRRHFSRDVAACCRQVLDRQLDVEFGVDADLAPAPGKAPDSEPSSTNDTPQSGRSPQSGGSPPSGNAPSPSPNGRGAPPRRGRARAHAEPTFASWIMGQSNACAVAAAELAGRGLQQASPLLVYGPTGVGKTHLLRAVRSEYRRCQPRARVVYLTAEQFTSHFVEAVRGTGLPSFRQKCRGADLLLIDDLQFFVGRRASLDELLYTVDTLQSEGRQLVLSADRPPGELRALGRELVSRLAGGLCCEIRPPDYATRLGIVRALAAEIRLPIDEPLAALVATRITATARELRGALHRLQVVSQTLRQPLSVELATSVLDEVAQQLSPVVRLSDVEQAVCRVFGVERSELRSERKTRTIHEPRMLAMWLARKYTRAAWSEIGQFFGRRSHSTVIAAHRRMERLIRSQGQIGVSHETCGVEEALRRVDHALRTG